MESALKCCIIFITTSPVLVAFNIHMNVGIMTLAFSGTVDLNSFNPRGITLQDARNISTSTTGENVYSHRREIYSLILEQAIPCESVLESKLLCVDNITWKTVPSRVWAAIKCA